MKVKVAVLQYDCPEETEASFKKLEEMISQASWMGAELVVTPETAVGNVGELKEKGAEILPRLLDMARVNKVYLATSYYTKEKGKFYDQGQIISPKGESILSYKKIYLAKPEIENIGVIPGNSLQMVETDIGKLGMLICKDGFTKYSHFLYEKLGEMGVEIMCVPSWSIGWKELDTQEYVKSMFVNGAFTSRAFLLMSDTINKTFNSYGRSLIVSPVRGVLKEGSVDRREILSEEIDLDEVKKAREFDSWWQPKKKIEVV